MIFKYQPDTEFPTPERCYIVELYNSKLDEDCSIARARVEPGVTTQLHALKGTIERYVILEGEGRVEVDGDEPTIVRTCDVVQIPAGTSQRITNTANTDLLFLTVCTPRFRPENYENLDAQ